MSSRGRHAAKGSAAQSFVANRGTPESLKSFLGGHAVPALEEQIGANDAAMVEVNLKLLQKTSDTTKLKALAELNRQTACVPEEALVPYVPSVAEAVLRHTQHTNPLVRGGVFALLKGVMQRGRAVKMALSNDLAALIPFWVLGMQDMESAVRSEAREAFHAAFSSEKRPIVLEKYATEILNGLIGTFAETLEQSRGKALQDDHMDPRSNTLFAALTAMGYMLKQTSAAQPPVIAFVERQSLRPLVPMGDGGNMAGCHNTNNNSNKDSSSAAGKSKKSGTAAGAEKGGFAARAPVVRSAALTLLRDIVAVCPLTPKLQLTVSAALSGAVLDTQVAVVRRAWELLLVWCREGATDAIGYFAPNFLDAIIDSLMRCNDAGIAEIIFPSLLPLLTRLSKDARCADIVDEFCGALVEKLRVLGETPNVSAAELRIVLAALMECWELLCLRKRGEKDGEHDGVELFTVCLCNLCALTEAPARRTRYAASIASTVSQSLVRAAARDSTVFHNCLNVLCVNSNALFRVLPDDATTGQKRSLQYIRALLVGSALALARSSQSSSSASSSLVSPTVAVTEREGLITALRSAAEDILSHLTGLDKDDTTKKEEKEVDLLLVTALLQPTPRWTPPITLQTKVAVALARQLTATTRSDDANPSSSPTSISTPVTTSITSTPFALPIASPTATGTPTGTNTTATTGVISAAIQADGANTRDAYLRELLDVVLDWDNAAVRGKLLESETLLPWAAEHIRSHDLRNPSRRLEALCNACKTTDFDVIRRCLDAVISDDANGTAGTLSELSAESAAVLRTIVSCSLNETLALVADRSAPPSNKSDEESSGEESEESVELSESDESSASGDSATNEGTEVLYRLCGWAELLRRGAPFATLIGVNDAFIDELVPLLLRAVAAVAPRLHPEQFVSIKALRVALQDTSDPLLLAVDRKTHALDADHFTLLVDRIEQFFNSHGVSCARRDAISLDVFNFVIDNPSCGMAASGQLARLVPFASDTLLRKLVCNEELWERYELFPSSTSEALSSGNAGGKTMDRNEDTSRPMLRRDCPISVMSLSLLRCVRMAQLVRLMSAAGAVECGDMTAVSLLLLRAGRVTAAFADPVQSLLSAQLLPRALLRFAGSDANETTTVNKEDTRKDKNNAHGNTTASHLLHSGRVVGVDRRESRENDNSALDAVDHFVARLDSFGLIPTLAVALRDVVKMDSANGLSSARRLASAVTRRAIDALVAPGGPRPISSLAVSFYRAFYTFLDDAADAARDSILSSIPSAQLTLIQEAICVLPEFTHAASLLLVSVHRHLAARPVVDRSTARQWLQHARQMRPIEGLELIAEAAAARVLDTAAYTEIVHTTVQLLSQCYRLKHMPPNGRLVTRAAGETTPSIEQRRRVVVAAIAARRGVVVHNRLDDLLRSSVNLVIFDIVAECVVLLRQSSADEVTAIAELLAFTSGFLSELLSADVAVLRASEASAQTVASVLNYVYQWLCATSIARLDAMGMDIVASAIRAVTLLSNLTLMRSTVDLRSVMQLIISKRTLKPPRTEFSLSAPAKMKLFLRHVNVIAKTNKQKTALFPHLLSWAIALSGPVAEPLSKQRREEVMQLLDLLCALLLASTVPGSKRVDDTFLCCPARASDGSPVEHLGFETVALTRPSDATPVSQLARGAAAVFTLLLQSNTLSVVKSWLDTIERKLQALFHGFLDEHVSPLLIQENLLAVLSKSPTGEPTFSVSENYTVSVSLPQHLVALRYTMEDASVMVQITFPNSFPLRQPTVTHDSGRDCGVSAEKWRAWMLKMTVMLFSGSSNVWDCVTLFGRNLDAHFNGQEPCPICFAVVSAVTHRLPEMRCAVCRNTALHEDCLYTWWANSGQTVCPLCRSPWVSN